MSTESLLAAVHAAANDPALTADAGNQPKENAMSTTTDKPAAPATLTSSAALIAAYPQLCAELQTASRTEGATAERARIEAIDKLARPGREKLIADAKADPAMTADKTAIAILAADDAAKDAQLAGIKSVETEGSKVKPAPHAGGTSEQPAKLTGTTPDEWKAEFAGSKELQAEFASAGDYVAFKQAEAAGKVRILRSGRAS